MPIVSCPAAAKASFFKKAFVFPFTVRFFSATLWINTKTFSDTAIQLVTHMPKRVGVDLS